MSAIVSLAGRTVVVTGAGQGIGKALVELALDLGANVVAVDLNAQTLEATLAPLPAQRVLKVVKEVGPDCAVRATRSDIYGGRIVPFVPFNQDLNRLTLTVTNLDAPRAKVTWGGEGREFTREQLAAGVPHEHDCGMRIEAKETEHGTREGQAQGKRDALA